MIWTQSDTIALAKQSCTQCFGLGLRSGRSGEATPCNCVFRAIWRVCFAEFHRCCEDEGRLSHPAFEAAAVRRRVCRKNIFSFKRQEYAADFILIARRVLGEDTRAYKLFKFHFLLGADWKRCTRKLGINRGEFFHEVYRVQQRLGRAFREVRPHALFPIDGYYGGAGRIQVEPEKREACTALPCYRAQSVT